MALCSRKRDRATGGTGALVYLLVSIRILLVRTLHICKALLRLVSRRRRRRGHVDGTLRRRNMLILFSFKTRRSMALNNSIHDVSLARTDENNSRKGPNLAAVDIRHRRPVSSVVGRLSIFTSFFFFFCNIF